MPFQITIFVLETIQTKNKKSENKIEHQKENKNIESNKNDSKETKKIQEKTRNSIQDKISNYQNRINSNEKVKYIEPIFKKEKIKEESVIKELKNIEDRFHFRVSKIKNDYEKVFKRVAPTTELKQLYDICCKISLNIIDLKKCHEEINFEKENLFEMTKENINIYSKYLQSCRGMRTMLNILCDKNKECEHFMKTIESKDSITFTELCILPALDIELYILKYQEWKLYHLNDKFGLKLGNIINNFNKFMKDNEIYINEIYQQEKFISIQKLLGIDDLASTKITGSNKKSKTETFIYDGILEFENKSCQVFLFDKLLIKSEMTLSGRKNELYPVKIGEFSVESIKDDLNNQCSFKIIFNDELFKIFKAKNEESKGKWIRNLQKISINKMEGERELITNLIEQSHTIDSPNYYYILNSINQLDNDQYNNECLPNSIDYIEYSNENENEIKCATFEKLIEKLTTPTDYDNLFLYSFLLTYRNFTTPIELLKKLIEKYNIRPKFGSSTTLEQFQHFKILYLLPMRLRISQILKIWITNHAYDFRNNKDLINLLNQFVDEMLKTKFEIGSKQISISIKKYIMKRDTFEQQQLNSISKEIQQLEMFTTPNTSPLKSMYNSPSCSNNSSPNSNSPKPRLPKIFSKSSNNLNDFQMKINNLDITAWDPIEISRQLILIEFNIFEKIRAKECLNQAWNKENRELKAPNIHEMILRTNTVVNWVAFEILKFEKVTQRQNSLELFLKVAIELKNLNAYNCLFEILGGLNSIAIHRLDETWKNINPKLKSEFEHLTKLISRKKNYGLMRNELKKALPPILPYIGLYLTDLTFIEDANKNILNDKINFSKCRKLAKVIREIQTNQQKPYEFIGIVELSNKLKNMNVFSEEQLIELSYKREPKE
eukprot:gene171-4417_t